MSNPEEQKHEEQIQAYLDGVMSPPERAAFEQLLRNNEQLSEMLDSHSQIADLPNPDQVHVYSITSGISNASA